MKTLLILLFIPNLASSWNIFTDICVPGQTVRRLQFTVDPNLEVFRFNNYIFSSEGIDSSAYALLLKGKKMTPDCKLERYKPSSGKDLYLTISKRDSTEPCVYPDACPE